MVKIKRTAEFERLLEVICEKDDKFLEVIEKHIVWFTKNPDDTRLRNHPLKRSLEGKWAFSVSGDIRIVYRWMEKSVVRFLAIGGHRSVYRKKGEKTSKKR